MLYKYNIKTNKREELIDITNLIKECVIKSKINSGIVIVFVPHTTSAITINENGDPNVKKDIIKFLNEKIPVDYGFSHYEGNSDAHIKSSLMGNSLNLIINSGNIILGMWQSVYFCEFDGPRNRELFIKVISD